MKTMFRNSRPQDRPDRMSMICPNGEEMDFERVKGGWLARPESTEAVELLTARGWKEVRMPTPAEAMANAIGELLSRSVKAVEEAIETGDYDSSLDAIADAEAEGKDRKGVAAVIADRKDQLAEESSQ